MVPQCFSVKLIRTASAMQRLAKKCQREGRSIGFVPTMGFLHEGHASLMRRARQAVGEKGLVVVSIFVNPTQFGPREDLSRYPRDLKRDTALCRGAGVDVIFHPAAEEMYPKDFSVWVVEESLSKSMEGASRPTHFRGVTTVVAKLFNLTLPSVAVFGAKDFQQAAVVQRMARDLNFPLQVIVAETVREADGLAMSSRNKYLNREERKEALVLSRAIAEVRQLVRTKKDASAETLSKHVAGMVKRIGSARLDYVAFFDPVTLEPARRVRAGARMALAVYIGKTRLIDNAQM